MNFNEVSVEQDDHMDYENNEITTTSAPDNDFVQNNDNEINESTSTVDEITTEKINDEMVESDFEEENNENTLEVTTIQPDIEIETMEEQQEITTESIKENDRFEESNENHEEDEEILDDDDDNHSFEEDFGVPIKPDDIIFDPLDDIADFQDENNHSNSLETDFEYIETPNYPDDTATSITDVDKGEYEVTTPQKYILEFEHTTIAFPYEEDIVSSSKPVFEAVVAEIEEHKRPASTDSAGLLLETTTGK